MIRNTPVAAENKPVPVHLPDKTPPNVSKVLAAVIPICSANACGA